MSHSAKELSSLLQQPHQTILCKAASRAHAVLVWGQDVVRHGRLLQHIGGDVLGEKNQLPDQSVRPLNQIINRMA